MTIRKLHLAAAVAAITMIAGAVQVQAQQVNVGAAANVGGLIVFVAQAKGFFAKNGIDAKVVTRNTGPALTKSLNAGEIDFAPAASDCANFCWARSRSLSC